MGGKKATNVVKEKRIFTVQGWIIDSVPDALIIQNIKNNWDLTRRQALRYLDEAYKRWNTESEATIEEKRQTRIAWLKNELRTMDEKYKNTPAGKRVVLAYSKELSKLEGLYFPKQIQHSGDKENPVNVKVVSTKFATEEMEDKFKAFLKKEYNFK